MVYVFVVPVRRNYEFPRNSAFPYSPAVTDTFPSKSVCQSYISNNSGSVLYLNVL